MGLLVQEQSLRGIYVPASFPVPYSSLAGWQYLGQAFPNPIDVGQLWVDPNTCFTWIYDPQRNQWVWVDQPPDADCLRRKAAMQSPPAPPATQPPTAASWLEQELVAGVKNWWLLGWGGAMVVILLVARKKRQ